MAVKREQKGFTRLEGARASQDDGAFLVSGSCKTILTQDAHFSV
jgi:hypothetical protein